MNRIRSFLRAVLWLVMLALPGMVVAAGADSTPEALIQATSEDLLAVIARTQDRAQLHKAVETKVAPHFDFGRMTRLSLGQSWQQATPAQQEELAQEFRKLLVRTYANAFATVKERKATVKVAAAAAATAQKEVTVKTRLTPVGRPAIALDYSMALAADGWKVFDVMVDGVSLVTNYRDSFVTEVRNSGVAGLIKTLAEKNRKNSTAAGE